MIVNVFVFAVLMQVSTINGQVRDAQTHATIPSSKVELSNAGHTEDVQYSDADGRFYFPDVDSGVHTMSVTHAGYNTITIRLDKARALSRVEIELTPIVEAKTIGPAVISVQQYAAPASARKLFDRAKKEMQKDCTKAIKHFESGLQIFDQDAFAHNSLGNCYRQLGQLQAAENSFMRAVALTDSPYVALNLAEVYTAQLKYSEAESVLDNARRKTPENGDLYYGLAAAYFGEKRIKAAEEMALQADSRIHRIADLHLLLAKIYDRRGNQSMVVEQFKLYLKEAPNGAESKRIRIALQSKG